MHIKAAVLICVWILDVCVCVCAYASFSGHNHKIYAQHVCVFVCDSVVV